MMWQAVVLAVQILLLAIGYALFQQARAELSARAAETPVLSEVKALQRSVKQLLQEIHEVSDETSAKLERHCADAREMMTALDRRLELAAEARAAITRPVTPEEPKAVRRGRASSQRSSDSAEPFLSPEIAVTSGFLAEAARPAQNESTRDVTRRKVYALADEGLTAAEIAQATTISEGEIETLLGLRLQRR